METLKLTLAAAALGALVALPVTSAHAWGGGGPWGNRGYTTAMAVAGAMVSAISLATSASI